MTNGSTTATLPIQIYPTQHNTKEDTLTPATIFPIDGDVTTAVVQFVRERETTNTVRFAEVVDEGDEALVGTLYLRKSALALMGAAEAANVTVTIVTSRD